MIRELLLLFHVEWQISCHLCSEEKQSLRSHECRYTRSTCNSLIIVGSCWFITTRFVRRHQDIHRYYPQTGVSVTCVVMTCNMFSLDPSLQQSDTEVLVFSVCVSCLAALLKNHTPSGTYESKGRYSFIPVSSSA